MKEKISVIVPVYNVEKYIEECISSIMRQTFDNLEIILVDDGSTDNSGKICDELAKKDLRINVIHQSNQGLSAARNTGLKHAMGDYISFIDSDDYIHIDMLNKLYEAIINSDSDLAICNYKYVYMQDFVGKHVDYQSPMHNEILTREEAIGKLFEATPWFYITATNKLYKRKIWKNMCFPEGYIHEDEAVVHRVFMKCKRIVTIKDDLYFYRQVNGSIINQGKSEKSTDIYYALTDRMVALQDMCSREQMTRMAYDYWYGFITDFYVYYNTNPKSQYLKRMKKFKESIIFV